MRVCRAQVVPETAASAASTSKCPSLQFYGKQGQGAAPWDAPCLQCSTALLCDSPAGHAASLQPGMEAPGPGYHSRGLASPAGRCRCPWLEQPRTTSESWETALATGCLGNVVFLQPLIWETSSARAQVLTQLPPRRSLQPRSPGCNAAGAQPSPDAGRG